jgi:hypothetical protein
VEVVQGGVDPEPTGTTLGLYILQEVLLLEK